MKWSAKKQPFHSCSLCLFNKKTSRIFDINPFPRVSEAQEARLDKWESFGRTLSSSTTTLVSRWVRRSTIWLKKCTIDPLHKNQKVKTICRWNVDFTLRNPWGRGYGTGGLTLEFAGFVLELFLRTLEIFHFYIWMFSFKGLLLYGSSTYIASIFNNFLKIPTIKWKVGEITANAWI